MNKIKAKTKMISCLDTSKPNWFTRIMSEKPDRLRLVKNKYLGEIAKKEQEISILREKLRLIDEVENDAEGLSVAANGALRYKDETSVIKSALDAVKSIGSGGVGASKVARYLTENGFAPRGNNFVISVGTSLKRLADRGEIVSELRGINRVFMPKS